MYLNSTTCRLLSPTTAGQIKVLLQSHGLLLLLALELSDLRKLIDRHRVGREIEAQKVKLNFICNMGSRHLHRNGCLLGAIQYMGGEQ